MRLAISLPTRGRPERVVDTLNRTIPLLRCRDTVIVVGVDDDDEPTMDALLKQRYGDDMIIDCRPREDALGAKWNRVTEHEADLYSIMSDYTPYKTEGFDKLIIEAAKVFPDGIGVVFSHMANWSFPSTQSVTRKLVDKLGWFYPPFFPYWFVDHWIDDIAKLIDRVAFADVQVWTPPRKIPTQELRDVGWWATFYDAMRLMRRRQARAIIDAKDFKEPAWRKEILRNHYPLVEFRSQAINDHVRSWAQVATTSGGPRYDRIKAQAEAMLIAEWPELEKELEVA